jgi:hypothetical protein
MKSFITLATGIIGHMEVDADTFASWEVDYVKLDGEFFLSCKHST